MSHNYNIEYIYSIFHFYADDTRLYLPVNPREACSLIAVTNHIQEIKCWGTHHYFQLNEDKTPCSVTVDVNEKGNDETVR